MPKLGEFVEAGVVAGCMFLATILGRFLFVVVKAALTSASKRRK